jgi:hypothetical protein
MSYNHATPSEASIPATIGGRDVAWTDSARNLASKESRADLISRPYDDAAPNEPSDGDYPRGAKLIIILSALCLAVFLVALDNTIVSTAIPAITDEFKSITDIGWYGSAYLLTSTAMQPTYGRIYTIFSVRSYFFI